MLGFTLLEVKTCLPIVVSMLVIVVVNVIEQPYARSLIVCDEPINPSEWSGSRHCGNRLHVIEQGAKLSGAGQALENGGRILITFFVSSFSDHGRKMAVVVGQAFILASVLLFVLAGFFPSWAVVLFVIAQGFQGMSGIGVIIEIVVGDVAKLLDDPVGVYHRKGLVGAALGIMSAIAVLIVLHAEMQDFTLFWSVVVSVSFVELLLLMFVFPETLPEDQRSKEPLHPITDAVVEVKLYGKLLLEDRFIRFTVLASFLGSLSDYGPSIGASATMAFFGLTNFECFLLFAPAMLLSPLFMGVVPGLSAKYSHRFIWDCCFWYDRVVGLWAALFFFSQPLGIPAPTLSVLVKLPLSGFGNLEGVWRLALTGEKNHPKFQGMMQLVGFVGTGMASWVYPYLFHPQAETGLGKAPFRVPSYMFSLLSAAVCHAGTSTLIKSELDKLDEKAKAKHKEEEATQEERENELAEEKKEK